MAPVDEWRIITATLDSLLADVRACTICSEHLPHGPRPVLQVTQNTRILIASQAPGRRVHESGIPFDDPSGDRLREWMGVTKEVFYDAEKIAIVPMGFYYPGTGKSGDLPPRPECAPAWRESLLSGLNQLKLTLVIGQYAQAYHFGKTASSVTETVGAWQSVWPEIVPLPHPSPRNNLWLKRNPWFTSELLPVLRGRIATILP